MKMTKGRTLIGGALVFALLAGCSGNGGSSNGNGGSSGSDAKQEHPLEGTWDYQQPDVPGGPATTTMVFAPDKSLLYTVTTPTEGLKQQGTWTATGSALDVKFSSCSRVATDGTETASVCENSEVKAQFSIAADQLTLVVTLGETNVTGTTIFSRR